MRREVAVIVAVLVGAVAGFFLGGGDVEVFHQFWRSANAGTPPPTFAVAPFLWAAVAAVVAGWIVNRWIEHKPKEIA
jgi:hypothetical protein